MTMGARASVMEKGPNRTKVQRIVKTTITAENIDKPVILLSLSRELILLIILPPAVAPLKADAARLDDTIPTVSCQEIIAQNIEIRVFILENRISIN
jgi:hypothetical protein